MNSVKQDTPKINISNDMEEDKSISSNSSEIKEVEYPSSSSSSVSVSFEDKKVIGENITNNNAVKNASQETQRQLPELEQDKGKKEGKRRKRDSFRRIKKEGEVLVKNLTGMFNKKQELDNPVPQSPRTRYRKSPSSSETQQKRHSFFSSDNNNSGDQPKTKTRDYPLSDDDNLKSNRKTRNRLSINFSDLIKPDDDKKEKENRRKTFHFTKDFSDNFINNYENNIDDINNNLPSGSKPVSVKTNFKSILSTTEYDSPIAKDFTTNSAPVSPTTNMINGDEKTIQSTQKPAINEDEQQIGGDITETKEQKSNETREAIITSSMTSTVIATTLDGKEQHIEEDNNEVVEQNPGRISNIPNDTEVSDDIRFDQIHNTTNDNNNNTNNQEISMITSTSGSFLPGTNDNNDSIIVTTNETNHYDKTVKTEIKLEENSKINTLESIVLRQLVLAEKMQETMSRLESKVSGQMEDTIRKLENKIDEQNVELDDLKTIVGKLQENQQMMIANEAYYNQDLQTIHRELALVSQTSSTSSFSLTQNLHQQHHQVYMKDTLVDTLVVKPLYKTITVSASVMYAVYIQPVVSLVRVVRQRL